ncbi:TAXI family TRAP transporter solute-binding subunit [Oceanobacillus senegalensis]|uniref:TAXI family TRAP transporter solute-binding subunit n=1 Tax=Oceanobacillus senegalensis TaxID=1936063 RepID=UPI000A30A8CB|nr:TAXI family TRAP transporter solute-binding subunit [Oceanobacillus senegalensis]
MRKKTLFTFVMLFVLAMVLVACGGGTDTGNEDGSSNGGGEAPEFLSMLTGGTSGTYYPLGGEMASIITDETGIQTDAISSNASADNVVSLQEGEAELAFVQTDVIANAVEGVNAFDGNPVDNVLALGSLYPETIQIVTTADSGIESVEDLKGKTVSVGAPGSGTYINAEQILEVHGLSIEDDIEAQNLDFGESTGGIQDGNIDAAFITAGTPTGAVEGLGATTDVSIVPIAEEKINELVEQYPYYAADTITAGTYGLEEDVTTVAVLAMLAVTDSLSEDAVYDITKAIYDNTDAISHAKGEFITKDSALDGIGIDLHPGAEKYFQEEGLLE